MSVDWRGGLSTAVKLSPVVVVVGEVARALLLSVLTRGDAGSPNSGVSLSFLLPKTRFRKPPWVEALLSVVPASLNEIVKSVW